MAAQTVKPLDNMHENLITLTLSQKLICLCVHYYIYRTVSIVVLLLYIQPLDFFLNKLIHS
jgi:hypothetical protein